MHISLDQDPDMWAQLEALFSLDLTSQVAGANYRARTVFRRAGRVTTEDVRLVYAWQRGRCFYCGEVLMLTFEIDHVTPLSAGGAHARANVALACASCNRKKAQKEADEFYMQTLKRRARYKGRRRPPPAGHKTGAWDEEEDAVLKKAYPKGGGAGVNEALVAAGLPPRAVGSIGQRASKLGVGSERSE